MEKNLIPAVYENGILHPLVPLMLPEHTKVQVYIQSVSLSDHKQSHRKRLTDAMIRAGLRIPSFLQDDSSVFHRLSEERRKELARVFSAKQAISDMIIAEREGR